MILSFLLDVCLPLCSHLCFRLAALLAVWPVSLHHLSCPQYCVLVNCVAPCLCRAVPCLPSSQYFPTVCSTLASSFSVWWSWEDQLANPFFRVSVCSSLVFPLCTQVPLYFFCRLLSACVSPVSGACPLLSDSGWASALSILPDSGRWESHGDYFLFLLEERQVRARSMRYPTQTRA